MLGTVFGVVVGFVAWVYVKRFLPRQIGTTAIAVFTLCLGAGLGGGLYLDSEIWLAIVSAIWCGPPR